METLPLQAPASCQPSWLPTFGGQTGADDSIFALTIFDDGSGPALYAGGRFLTTGGVPANRITKWDGVHWSPLGSGMDGEVRVLSVFDDGSGAALYAGGTFTTAGGVTANRIAKWNGSSWSALASGMNGDVRALTVFDDGSGAALFAGGDFTIAGGVAANYVAEWNGSSWSPLGSGMSINFGPFVYVSALTTFDDGSGPALYAGGSFTMAGGVPANYIAKWNGSSWSALGNGASADSALTVFDDGSGPALYAGGSGGIAKWDGSSWSALGSGIDFATSGSRVLALAVFDDGSGPALYVGGWFTGAGGVAAENIARWKSGSWSALGSGMSGVVSAFRVFDDGSGPALYAGGRFTYAGGVRVNYVGRWNGASWSALGTGVSFNVTALTDFDDGSGPALYVGGGFQVVGGVNSNRIAKWNGTSWSTLGSGMDDYVLALTVFDDGSGPALYAGGPFTSAGGLAASRIAKWNGSSWSTLGSGMTAPGTGNPGSVLALTTFDAGTGPELYAGGSFTAAGGAAANNIAKWNGSSWSALGSGMNNGYVSALTVFDDGSGPALYAGGYFTLAGGVSANYVAKWNGSSWSALGSGMSIIPGPFVYVSALATVDDGSGPALYAGGSFTMAGGVAANNIAKWNGSSWSALGSGMNGDVAALTGFDDGHCSGPALFAGGYFTSAIDSHDSYLAKWDCVPQAPTPGCFDAFCFGDGIDPNVTTACPCANFGAPRHGCANSVNTEGARLFASGNASPDTIVLAGALMPASVPCIYLQGDALDDDVFGDGVRCAGGALIRLRTKMNSGGASQFPEAGDPSVSVRGMVMPGSGAVRFYQAYYRNASAAFCPPATFNVTNGWKIAW